MEGFSTHLSEILSNYTYDALRQITKKLSGTGTKKPEMISYIVSYLARPENHTKLPQIFPPELTKDLSKVLPDKDLSCICDDYWKVSSLLTCTICLKKLHSSCMGNLTFLKKFICISCQLKLLNPSDEVLQFLIAPFVLTENKEKSRQFTYSNPLKTEISDLRTGVEVQLRCIKVQSPGFSISWPKGGSLIVNKKIIKEFKSGKRKDFSIDISILLHVGTNEIGFIKKQDPDDYCLALVKVKKHPTEELFQRFLKNPKPAEKFLKIVQKNFLPENEVKPSLIKVEVKCPYSLQTIKTPARGKKCEHINCFDLFNFIEFQKFENYVWKCPVCKGPAYDVYVDGYLLEALQQFEHVYALEVFEDGRILPLLENSEENQKGPNQELEMKKEIKYAEIISD